MTIVDPIIADLRAERRRRGWSQQQVAFMAGVSQRSMSLWERGLMAPGVDHLRRWSSVLGFDLTVHRQLAVDPVRQLVIERFGPVPYWERPGVRQRDDPRHIAARRRILNEAMTERAAGRAA